MMSYYTKVRIYTYVQVPYKYLYPYSLARASAAVSVQNANKSRKLASVAADIHYYYMFYDRIRGLWLPRSVPRILEYLLLYGYVDYKYTQKTSESKKN